ncbi:MAG: hypothetical protein GEU87_13665 [Alphaproteobacteria bacterium]|nr:hypothetical protein [Alphaproteobacteria bacterium]
MTDSADDKPGVYIGGVYHAVADKNAPPVSRPSEAQELERAADRLEDRRAGVDPAEAGDDYMEAPEPRRTFKNADAAAAHRQVEAEQTREVTRILQEENTRQQDERARGEIRQASEWHADDAAVLNGLTARVQQFNSDAATFTSAYQHARFARAAECHLPHSNGWGGPCGRREYEKGRRRGS